MNLTNLNEIATQLVSKVKVSEPATFNDFYQEVKKENLVPITDENNNIIGFNTVRSTPSSMKVCKKINGVLTVGDTEEQRLQDEKSLAEFKVRFGHAPLQCWFKMAYMIKQTNLSPDYVEMGVDNAYLYFLDQKVVYSSSGDKVVDLSEDPEMKNLPNSVTLKLLKAAVNKSF